MPLRTGIDITHISRVRDLIERFGNHFKQRYFPHHVDKFQYEEYDRPETYAGMWAAKEAVFKVLGRGYRWRSIFIDHEPTGRPVVRFPEPVCDHPDIPVPPTAEWDCSITHDADMAVAFAVCFWMDPNTVSGA